MVETNRSTLDTIYSIQQSPAHDSNDTADNVRQDSSTNQV